MNHIRFDFKAKTFVIKLKVDLQVKMRKSGCRLQSDKRLNFELTVKEKGESASESKKGRLSFPVG